MDKLGIDWRILIAQTISFSVVFFVLWKFAYGPIFAMLNTRREKIAEALANAEKIKGDVARTESERQKILADAGDKANKLIDDARQAAARVREQETQKAIADPTVKERLDKVGILPLVMSQPEFQKYFEADVKDTDELAKKAGIEKQ